MNPKQIRELADNTFTKKLPLNILHQDIAENFFPQRADFTLTHRSLSDDFASTAMTSFPILCARELGGAIPSMLRPTAKEWFQIEVAYDDRVDLEGKAFLQWAAGVQRKAMYDPVALFNRATALADMDYSVFGSAVMQCTINDARDALLHRTWHLRDCAWLEDDHGNVCPFFRRWKRQARVLVRKFPNTAHRTLISLAEKEPFREINCLHMIVDAETYDGNARGHPYWSILYDCDHETMLEAAPVWNKQYAIPRWQLIGSQYPYSPAVIAALPEARLLQAMTYTLLEAGEKATNPPLVATEGAVRSDLANYAGGTTWVDFEYDERLGDAVRPLNQDLSGLPFGHDQQRDCRAILKECFFLNKIRPFIPTDDPQMTAFQASQIVAQYIRDALPIFEPMEPEYNGQICELDFDILMRNGAFGSPLNFPRSIRGKETHFRFQSPLHDAIEAQKGHRFLQMKQIVLEAMALDRNAIAVPNVIDALRDALDGVRTPAKWINSPVRTAQIQDKQQQIEQSHQLLAALKEGGEAAALAGSAARDMAQARATGGGPAALPAMLGA